MTKQESITRENELQQYCTFSIQEMLFGFRVEEVQEIISFQHMTPVPLSSSEIKGLINLRGQIIVAIDLRQRLGFPALEGEAKPMNVVVKLEQELISFLVDDIGDILGFEEHVMETPPQQLDKKAHEFISGIYKIGKNLLVI